MSYYDLVKDYMKVDECKNNKKYSSAGHTFCWNKEDLTYAEGLYWFYEGDGFIIDIHDFYIKEEVIHVETLVKPIDQVFEEGTKDVFTNDRGDFTARKAIKMVATAYEAGPRSTGKRPGDKGYGITASGARAKRGTVAVDPRVIPLGTKLYIKSLTPGVPDYGFAIAQDTGGAIKGNKIDLFMDTVWECLQFGRRPVMVYILQ